MNHFMMQRTHRHRHNFWRTCEMPIDLFVSIPVFFQQSCIHHKIKRLADISRRGIQTTTPRYFTRSRSRHHRRQLSHYRMYPSFKILVSIAIDNFHRIVFRKFQHRFKNDFAIRIRFSMATFYHQLKIVKLVPYQVHCSTDFFRPHRQASSKSAM